MKLNNFNYIQALNLLNLSANNKFYNIEKELNKTINYNRHMRSHLETIEKYARIEFNKSNLQLTKQEYEFICLKYNLETM